MIFKYTGGLDIDTLLKYLSADNFKAPEYATVYNDNLAQYTSLIDGSYNWMTRISRMSDDLTLWANDQSLLMFKKLKLYHWTPQSKLLIFILTGLGFPAVIATYFMLYGFLWMKRTVNEVLCPKKKRVNAGQVQQQVTPPTSAPATAPAKT